MSERDTWRQEGFEQLPDAALVLDTDCIVRAANGKACEVLGLTREEIVGKPCSESCICGRGAQHCFVRQMFRGEEAVREKDTRLITSCGKTASMFVTAVPIRDDEGRVVGGMEILRDVSLLEGVNSDLKRLADTDDLTGLSRRHVLFGALEREAARHRRYGNPYAILMIDIDNFKRFNDRFGHQAGDEILRRVGAVLREEVRREDTIARYGGEEFASVLAETDSDRAVAVAERMQERIRNVAAAGAGDGEGSTISVGVASCDGGPCRHDPHSMIKLADDALYEAKRAGKDAIRVAPAPGSRAGNGD
jgi:diguanylate cyclase (GGDEF)-like protein/PAS domain S-box-containing protein